MSKTIVLIYKLPTLYEILHEINDLLNDAINKEILTCNNIKSFNKNNKKFEVIYNENLKHTDLNEVIKNNNNSIR